MCQSSVLKCDLSRACGSDACVWLRECLAAHVRDSGPDSGRDCLIYAHPDCLQYMYAYASHPDCLTWQRRVRVAARVPRGRPSPRRGAPGGRHRHRVAGVYIYLASVYLSIYLSIYLYLFICLTIFLSIYLSIYMFVFLSIYLSIDLSIDLSVYLSIYLFIYVYIKYVYLSINLSIYLSIYLYIYIYIYFYIERFRNCWLSFDMNLTLPLPATCGVLG